MYLGAIEAGGTKFVCGIGTEKGKILEKKVIPTTSPEKTMKELAAFFKKSKYELSGIGVASFGPLEINPKSKQFGKVLETPKILWRGFNYFKYLKKAFSLPIAINTDVNGAAIGELEWGAAKGLESFLYMTVGTGIGVGGMVLSRFIMGLSHSEMGHIYIPIHPKDKFKGVCPSHKNCLEGLASGPSMMKRWKIESAKDLPKGHFGWELESWYLAAAVTNYILCFSPQRIIIGGGVLKTPGLIQKVRKDVLKFLNGYLHQDEIVKHIDRYIVLPKLKGDAGILGGIALVKDLLKSL